MESMDCEQGRTPASMLEEWREQEDEERGSGGDGEIEPEQHAVHDAREELPLGHVPGRGDAQHNFFPHNDILHNSLAQSHFAQCNCAQSHLAQS